MKPAKVYVIPSLLGDGDFERVIPVYNLQILRELNHFAVENEKSARRFIKQILPEKKQSELQIEILNKHSKDEDIQPLLQLLYQGNSVGIISEAGMPGIADPGAKLVEAAHSNGYQVIPLCGPSSIFLALAASGFNGQSFSFHGYLPIDKRERKIAIQQLEMKSKSANSTEIFMETPYRNHALIEDLLQNLSHSTRLCIACDLTLNSEFVFAASIKEWKNQKLDFHKRPAIFLIQADY
ncbi:MAG: SAM-dependent methyltransferase [Flavobacteriaceae bacterium]|nr:SAM-dependent methyltransferase [Flavobacteriaceae bacterium]